ncbi:hypothetical protein HWV62_10795 [Athelia sp. TMB]|nr:hypothetical protein HWV62_10795 [Athelia sp. TMB]
MLPLASSALIFFASSAAIAARAIITDVSSISAAGTSSFITSSPTNTTIPSSSCKDIDHCRTLAAIVQSCIVTVLACVWFAVHRNIPAPSVDHPHDNSFVRILLFVWYKIVDQRQALTVFVVTLLVPEWVLAWALRQFLNARRLAEELEEAREEASLRREAELSEGRGAEKDVNESADDQVNDEPRVGSAVMLTRSEHDRLIKRQTISSDRVGTRECKKRCEECGLHCCVDDVREFERSQIAVAERVHKASEEWKIAHAFFVIMGGYYFYDKNGPRHPVSPAAAVELVRRGHLVAPTRDELANQSKGDVLSKGVAILQTLWFVMQCIARRIEHLPITNLEVMTLAYTVITVAMYIVWWDKPLNVSCAVRVPEEEVEEEEVEEYGSVWDRILTYVIGMLDQQVDLRQCTRVPTFWAGNRHIGNDVIIADVIALLVAMVFGAVHCIAWFDSSQSHLEQQLWRAAAIAIISTPAALVMILFLVSLLGVLSDDFVIFAMASSYVLVALVYAAARLALIVLSFTSLHMLPVAAFQTVQWTTLVPHI